MTYDAIAAKGERVAILEPIERMIARLSGQWSDQETDAQPLAAAIEKNLALLGFGKKRGFDEAGPHTA